MENLINEYKVLRMVVEPQNAFVERDNDNISPEQKEKRNKFISKAQDKVYSILKTKGIYPRIFAVREFSQNNKKAQEKHREYIHAHILIFIPLIEYNESIITTFPTQDDYRKKPSYPMKYKLLNKDQSLNNHIDAVTTFINYMLKGINQHSQLYLDYNYVNCPIHEYITTQIDNKKKTNIE